jgi:hypothetical protein
MHIYLIVIIVVVVLIAAALSLYFLLKCDKCGGSCFDKASFGCVNGQLCPISQYANPSLCCDIDSVAYNGGCSKFVADNYGNICPEHLYNAAADMCCQKDTVPCGPYCTAGECKGNCPADYLYNGSCSPRQCGSDSCSPGFPHCIGGVCYDMCPYEDGFKVSQFQCVNAGISVDENGVQCPGYQMGESKCCSPGTYFNTDLSACVQCAGDSLKCGDSCCAAGEVCGTNNMCCDPSRQQNGVCYPNGINGKCLNSVDCGGICCPIGYDCNDGKCVKTCGAETCSEFQTCKYVNGQPVCTDPPCPGPQFTGSKCCDNGEYSDGGVCKNCDSTMTGCGTSCCAAGKTCVAGIACV